MAPTVVSMMTVTWTQRISFVLSRDVTHVPRSERHRGDGGLHGTRRQHWRWGRPPYVDVGCKNLLHQEKGKELNERFDREYGAAYAKQVLSDASSFTWGIFNQPDPSDRRPADGDTVTLAVRDTDGIASTSGSTIQLSARSVGGITGDNLKEQVDGVLYHEVAHVWQWGLQEYGAHSGIFEGIADYVRLKAGYVAANWVKEGGGDRWDQGYDVTARFLDYCDSLKAGFVAEMNGKLKDGYSDDYFGKYQVIRELRSSHDTSYHELLDLRSKGLKPWIPEIRAILFDYWQSLSCFNELDDFSCVATRCIEGLDLALHWTVLPIVIELDYARAVSMLKASPGDRSRYRTFVRDIQLLMLEDRQEISITHIRRTQNKVSHSLAAYGRSIPRTAIWFGTGTDEIVNLCIAERPP
ncbi:hypothetical protein VPH35_002136 [Triticum aestivum]